MEVVADANIVFSAIIRDSATRKLLYGSGIIPFSPDFLFEELAGHKEELLEKSGLDSADFGELMPAITGLISIIGEQEFSSKMENAREICPDEGDIPYFALCLAKNIPLWSNDRNLKSQGRVKVYSTAELLKLVEGNLRIV